MESGFQLSEKQREALESTVEAGGESAVPRLLPSLSYDAALSHNVEGDGPAHRLLIGDNYHALAGLQAGLALSPEGLYDLIYIDPPYNTGNKDFRYNDNYVDATNPYRSGYWLSVLEPRLRLAKQLLKPSGVIFIAIGEREQHTLRNLCDTVFGRDNFLNTLVWDGTVRKNDAQYGSNTHDYMLVYAANKAHTYANGKDSRGNPQWQESKEGIAEALEAADRAWEASDADPEAATKRYRAWRNRLPADHPCKVKGTSMYSYVDGGGLHRLSDLGFPNGVGPRYDVPHPVTGVPVKVPGSGWVAPESTMRGWVEAGKVRFGKDETTIPQFKRYLRDYMIIAPTTVTETNKHHATSHLKRILGEKKFPFPKDHVELARWFRMAAPKNARILDFYGGSGSTAEAVLMLNTEDGGTREVTIVTNDENGIGTKVTRERIVRVMTGENWADGKAHKGYGGRLITHRVGVTRVEDIAAAEGEDEAHSWSVQAGAWGAWPDAPVPLIVEDTHTVYGGTGNSVVAFAPVAGELKKVVDDVLITNPGARVFMPHTLTSTHGVNGPFVSGVPNAIPLPMPFLGRVERGIRDSAVTPYVDRGGHYRNDLIHLIENYRTEG